MKKVIILSILFFLLLAGCSKSNSNKAKVRIAYLQGDLHQLACWIALEKGLFKAEGVDVEVAGIFKAGPEEMSAFASKSIDVGYVGQAPATTAVANKTADVKVIAQVNKEGSAIVVRKNSKIKHISQLAGKSIAIPGHSTVQDFLLRKALNKYGIKVNKVNDIVLKPPEMIGALKTDQIDAFIAWEPYPAKAVTMGIGKILMTSNDIWKGHQCCVLVVDSEFMNKNIEKIKGILRAHVHATDFIRNNPNEAVQIAVKYTGMDKDTIRHSMKTILYDYIPVVDGEIEYVEFLSKLGYIKVDNAKDFTEKFVDTKIIHDIKTK